MALIEVLIVVVLMALLAAAVVPHWLSSIEDAEHGALEFDLRTIRNQIELYKLHHGGRPPTLAVFARQMTEKTNASGGFTGDTLHGPYLRGRIPRNPFNHSRDVVGVASAGTPPEGIVAGGAGWQYDETTGGFYPNNPEWFE